MAGKILNADLTNDYKQKISDAEVMVATLKTLAKSKRCLINKKKELK